MLGASKMSDIPVRPSRRTLQTIQAYNAGYRVGKWGKTVYDPDGMLAPINYGTKKNYIKENGFTFVVFDLWAYQIHGRACFAVDAAIREDEDGLPIITELPKRFRNQKAAQLTETELAYLAPVAEPITKG